VLAFILAFINFFYAQAAHSDVFSSRPYRVVVARDASADVKHLVEAYLKVHPDANIELSSDADGADIYISKTARKGFDSSTFVGYPAMELVAGSRNKTLRPPRDYRFSYKKTGIILKVKSSEISGLEEYLKGYYGSAPVVEVTMVGDIIPGRHVAEYMAKKGVSWPFKLVAPLVSRADLTIGDLECPLTDRYEVPYAGMEFVAPAETVKGIQMLGLDIAALANNHSTNFGRTALTDTIELLKENRIAYAGGGYDYDEAHHPAYLEVGGTTFAYLNYNSIKGSLDASATEPGVAWINLQPWYPDSEQDFVTVESDIREASKQADVVIVGFHWSKEYVYEPNSSMVALARRACDAGADMVIGQHPHSVQSLEYYDGKFIAYSLGNFIFDQRFSEQVRQGFFLNCGFTEGILTSLEMVPYRINNACQTVPYEGSDGQPLLDKVLKVSGWKLGGASI
jgi:Bacterial capsule synthesis protein PGA_cap